MTMEQGGGAAVAHAVTLVLEKTRSQTVLYVKQVPAIFVMTNAIDRSILSLPVLILSGVCITSLGNLSSVICEV